MLQAEAWVVLGRLVGYFGPADCRWFPLILLPIVNNYDPVWSHAFSVLLYSHSLYVTIGFLSPVSTKITRENGYSWLSIALFVKWLYAMCEKLFCVWFETRCNKRTRPNNQGRRSVLPSRLLTGVDLVKTGFMQRSGWQCRLVCRPVTSEME